MDRCLVRALNLNLQLNLSTMATSQTEESGSCGEVAVMGR